MSFTCIHCQSPIEPHYKACPSCGEPLSDFVRNSLIAPIDGKYQILSRLGRGGMGEVYKVLHIHLNTIRVIKLMRPNIVGDASAQERFAREARLATKVHHPNVATLHDFSTLSDGSFYMVWEYIEGKDLTRIIRERKRLSPRDAAMISIQALRGLDAIHRAGIVHRDLSPDNIMLSQDENGDDVVKIIDLGIAKNFGDPAEQQTQTGMFVGKWRYCSPEHLGLLPEGEKIDGRADIYSYGILMYEMLTGEPPFIADGPQQYYAQHAKQTPKPMRVLNPVIANAPQLEALIFKALEKDRSRRFATAREFADELQSIVSSLPASTASFDATETLNLAASEPTVRTGPSAMPTVRQSQAIPSARPAEPPDAAPTLLTPVGAQIPGATLEFSQQPRRSFTLLVAAVATLIVVASAIGFMFLRRDSTPAVVPASDSAAVAALSPPVPGLFETGTPLPAATSVDVTSSIPETATTETVAPEAAVVPVAPKRKETPKRSEPVAPPVAIDTEDDNVVETVEVETVQRPRRVSRFGRRGGPGTLSASPEARLPAFRRGIIDDYDVMSKGGEVQWAWIAPGTKLVEHRIVIGNLRNLTSYDSADLRRIFTDDLQSALDDETEGQKETLTAEVAIFWSETSRALKRGVGVEVILRDSSREPVVMLRHQQRESSPEAAAEEVVEAIADYVSEH